MDLATVSGIAISFLLVFLAIFSGGRLSLFLDPHSALIVFGGTLGATLVNYPLKQALGVLLVVKNAFLTKS
jgi:chemotaxis protein MotA